MFKSEAPQGWIDDLNKAPSLFAADRLIGDRDAGHQGLFSTTFTPV